MASETYLTMKNEKYMLESEEYWEHPDDMNEDTKKCYQQQVVFIREPYMNSQSAKPKTRRRRWTQKDMTNAFNAVKCTGMSLRGAASHYNVPESTLRDRVHGRVSLDCSRPGPPTFFTFEEEKKMVDHILFMSKIGYPYTRNQVVELAGDMTKAVDRIAPFKFLNPSQAWFYAFLNRWPDLKNYLYGPRSNRKSKGVSAESIQSYYDNLEKVLCKYEIHNKPENIWMTDEISIACDNSNVPKILPITIQRPQSNTYWNPTAAVLGAGNAAGDKIPAFLMFKANEITNEMMEGAVKGSKFATSSTGWINADAFIQWYERHFRPLITQRPVILLYDGHLQFVTVRVLEKAKEDNVLLFPLPPHPPYNHCVESSCFAAYPKYFNRKIQKFHDDFKRNVNKTNVSKIICQAYECALTPINLISIFFKLGICPYNNLSSTIAPYMSDNYNEYGNDENQENNESDYSHGGKMYRGSDVASDFETSADSPIDRSSYTPINCSDDPSATTTYHQSHKYSFTNAPSTTSTSTYSSIINSSNISSTITSTNSQLLNLVSSASNPGNTLSPIKFGTQQQVSPHNSASHNSTNTSNPSSLVSTPVKVLDNMASKAMSQIHAHRSSVDTNTMVTTLIPLSAKNDQQNSQNFIPVKNFSGNRNQIILCNKNKKISASPTSAIKLISSSDILSTINNTKHGSASSPVLNTAASNSTNPIKVIKTTSSSNVATASNVIIKTGKNDNRPLLRLHSSSTDGQPPTKKQTLLSKSEGFIKCPAMSEMSPSNPVKLGASGAKLMLSPSQAASVTASSTVSTVNQLNNAVLTTSVNTTSSAPLEMTAELMEVKSEIINHEADEMSQTCNVCGCVEPPGLSQIPVDNEELVVDWARCDFCYKWVHLVPCCDSRCVQPDNTFKCIVCIRVEKDGVVNDDSKQPDDSQSSSNQNVPVVSSLVEPASVVLEEDNDPMETPSDQ